MPIVNTSFRLWLRPTGSSEVSKAPRPDSDSSARHSFPKCKGWAFHELWRNRGIGQLLSVTELVFRIEIAGHFDSWHRAAPGVSAKCMDLLDTLSRFWPHLGSGFHVLAALLASIHALLRKRDSRSATLWLVTIWFLPVLGPILYLALGINRN